MNTLPALPPDLPPSAKAKLPATYEGAKVALAECSRIDECQDWADKAEALASYAKQAQDEELRKMADRIQARAIRRCGELLQQIQTAAGARTDLEPRAGALPKLTRTDAAREAGLSEHQRKTALRVVRVPDPEFEEAVEADDPATVTDLARRGTQGKPPKESKEAQIRALRERHAAPPISKAGVAFYAEQSVEQHRDSLKQILSLLKANPKAISDLDLATRVRHARACLVALNVTLDDLHAAEGAP